MRQGTLALVILIGFLIFAPLNAGYAADAKPLTNADVIALVQAGLPEGVVIEKIRTSPSKFDTSTEALVRLKKEGVPDAVIRLVVNPHAKDAAASASSMVPGDSGTPAPCQVPLGGGPVPWLAGNSPAMWYVDQTTNERVEMMYERGSTEMVGFAGIGAVLLVLHPLKATVRLGPRPKFIGCINPVDAPLVKFSLDQKADERNTSLARGVWGIKHTSKISEKDLIAMDFKKTPQGFFEITPRSDLAPGEYGFVPQVSGLWVFGERVYGFGVD